MPLTGCTSHHGLINAIGSCSEETKATLIKALSYLGISYVTRKASSVSSSTFALSLQNDGHADCNVQIEFNSETGLWQHVKGISASDHKTIESKPGSNIEPALLANTETASDVCSLSPNQIANDWTTLLPTTSHVDFLKSREWHNTSLGPMKSWPYTLKLMTMKMLADPRPANLYWGPTRIAIYNEPFSIIAASRHPMMMGSTAEDAMPATYPFLSPIFDEIEKTGIAFSMPEFEMSVEKVSGFIEEAWYDGIFSCIRDTDGTFLGLYNSGYDITDHKLVQRNSELIRQIVAGRTLPITSPWEHIINVCRTFDRDVPFLVLYSVDEEQATNLQGLRVRYQGSLGIESDHSALPKSLDLYHGNDGFMPVLRAAKAKQSSVVLEMPNSKLPAFLEAGVTWRGHGDPCTHIIASPLYVTGLLNGFIIIGLNPRRGYDEKHKCFVEDIGRAVIGLLAYGINVGQAKKREEQLTRELTERQKFLQRIAQIATVGIFTSSIEGLLTWANPKYFDISGVTQKAEDRYNFESVNYLLDEDQQKGKDEFLKCIRTKSPCTIELRLKKTWRPSESDHDELCWVMTTLAPYVENDEVVDILGCLTDISHLKWAEKVQTEAAEAAKLAKQQQERFIDVTSHEMRNPLSAILQCADDISTMAKNHEILSGNEITETFQAILENAKSILFCATHQNRIADDILMISKLDSSMMIIVPEPTDPHNLVVQVMKSLTSKMDAEGIQSFLEIQSGYADLQITSTYIDPSRVTQILINLITNAIKFTKKAQRREINVRINALKQRPPVHSTSNRIQWFPSSTLLAKQKKPSTRDPVDKNEIYLMFEVEDSGMGISKEETKRLFNRFAQATPKTHVTYGGSGLGLFISRELAEIQGGMISVSSKPNVGSLFAFYIEAKRVEPTEYVRPNLQQTTLQEGSNILGTEKTLVRRSLVHSNSYVDQLKSNSKSKSLSSSTKCQPSNPWSILFVEDNLINQKILTRQLEGIGCKVCTANNGAEALDIIRKSAHWTDNQIDSLSFDVILMDWEMPVMDGITCTKQIRKLEADGTVTKHLLIVGATANARPEQVDVALTAGMDDLITKPFTVAALIQRIEGFLR